MASLKKQTIRSVKWTTLQATIVGISGPIFLIIKVRYLRPREFGYVAVIVLIIGLFQLIEDLGISQAIIQRDEINRKESSTLFIFNLIFCCSLATTLCFLSPWIAHFYSLPSLVDYLPVVSIIIIITGTSFLFQAFLEKQMFFKQLSLIAIIKNLLILGSTTLFLIFRFGVWGIIYGQIIGAAFATLSIIFVASRFKTVSVSFYFNPKKLIPFLRFGFFVSAKQLMTFVSHRLDEILIGHLLTPEILGIYHFGKEMMGKVRHLITSSFGKVLFPLFSKLKKQPQKLTVAYQRISRYIAFGAFPIFACIAVTTHLFVPIVFGKQWTGSIIVIQVLSITMIFMVLTANLASALLNAVNKPDLLLYIDVLTNILYFVSLFLLASHGMVAILLAYFCYVIYKTLILQFYVNRQLCDSFLSYFSEFKVPASSTLVMVMAVLIFQLISRNVLGLKMQFAGSIAIGFMAYGIMTFFFAWDTLSQIKAAIVKGEIGE